MANDKYQVFKNKKGTLDIVKLKHPTNEDRDQVIFCNPGELTGLFNAIKEYLGVHMEVKEEVVLSDSKEPQGREWCEQQNKRIAKLEKLSKGNEVRITAMEELLYNSPQHGAIPTKVRLPDREARVKKQEGE